MCCIGCINGFLPHSFQTIFSVTARQTCVNDNKKLTTVPKVSAIILFISLIPPLVLTNMTLTSHVLLPSHNDFLSSFSTLSKLLLQHFCSWGFLCLACSSIDIKIICILTSFNSIHMSSSQWGIPCLPDIHLSFHAYCFL